MKFLLNEYVWVHVEMRRPDALSVDMQWIANKPLS